jgi:hypothetical protein
MLVEFCSRRTPRVAPAVVASSTVMVVPRCVPLVTINRSPIEIPETRLPNGRSVMTMGTVVLGVSVETATCMAGAARSRVGFRTGYDAGDSTSSTKVGCGAPERRAEEELMKPGPDGAGQPTQCSTEQPAATARGPGRDAVMGGHEAHAAVSAVRRTGSGV